MSATPMISRPAAWILAGSITAVAACAPPEGGPTARFEFDGSAANAAGSPIGGVENGAVSFVEGLTGNAIRFGPGDPSASLTLDSDSMPFGSDQDFSVQFWTRTDADPDQRFVVLSQKEFNDNSLASQKNAGWVFFVSGGTWAWSLGAGSRRITYERDNGQHMPMNDGRWHQLAMTYSAERAELRLFYDGVNWVTYHVTDSNGFDFTNPSPLVVGWNGEAAAPPDQILPGIEAGAARLQELLDAFDALGLSPVEPDELLEMIAEPRDLFEAKVAEAAARRANGAAFSAAMEDVDWEPVSRAESALMSSPYTVHQNQNFTGIALVTRLYALVDGEIVINADGAREVAEAERLSPPDFEMDDLRIWHREVSPEEMASSYTEHYASTERVLDDNLASLTAGAWNIWHGGKHWTSARDGWDSRVAIAELIEDEGADVVMMQETYSSGDFIAAELGYYFATTVDWDYLNQGANISVLSRYPITEVHVEEGSPFQNVGTKVAISRTQDLYVMSNWYGMDRFPHVFDFHQARFGESDSIPTLFAGDFNAVPHTDGGDSPASVALLDAGFTDAYRSLHPDVASDPGPTHRNGTRIDQLYYKGAGWTNTSTTVISTRAGGFPSDHSLILARFDLDEGGGSP
jgi:endonuclease/exonuclease/phosphatase family metal-dependent hydrolase